MILQALTRYYEDLLQQGRISPPGWETVKVSYGLSLSLEGKLLKIFPTMHEEVRGKKTALVPDLMQLPAAVKRTAGVSANFLWDNSAYLLGVDQKGKPERSAECFAAAKQKHHEVLDQVDSPVARAILAFFDTWEPAQAAQHPALAPLYEGVTAGVNLTFRVEGRFSDQDPAIREAWQRAYDAEPDGAKMQCLVTGEYDTIQAIHPAIKGVRGAQSSGAALVSFNAPAFCSYGHEQNFNAPVGKRAAFAYTTALNHLLSERETVYWLGNTTVVYWAEGAEPQYEASMKAFLFGDELPQSWTDNDLRAALKRLANGLPVEELGLDPDRRFYILGLSPNAARLSVRFFQRDSFGELARHIKEHYERLEIKGSRYPLMPLWALLQETVNLNTKDRSASPLLAGAVARTILSGTRYPAALLSQTMLRIRAERDVTPGRAAILKAYYLKNEHEHCPKEVLTVSLNEESTNTAYVLGRLFSLYEGAQQSANPGINTTIKDKYFNSVSATPATIFPILGGLYQKHLRKMEPGLRVYYDKQVTALKDKLEEYPQRMDLPQQGAFDLGYYHQTQKRYEKKEEK